MNKTIIAVALLILVIISVNPAKLIAEDVVEKPCMYNQSNKDCVKNLVDIYAKKYHVSANKMMQTLENENNTFDFDLQSRLTYKKGNRWKQPAGSRELSFGIAQIHLPDHPDITKEQATNPEFAVNYMASEFSKGRQSQWMGYE